jgi:hypothetical protein
MERPISKRNFRTSWWKGLVGITISLVVATACDSSVPSNAKCEGSFISWQCTIKSGRYSDFSIGMTKEAAFETICQWHKQGKLSRYLVFYLGDQEKSFYDVSDVSICSLKAKALASDKWQFLESHGTKERYVWLGFEDSRLRSIHIAAGWSF